MENIQATDSMASAIQFINSTSAHIFLTGKAGTGKTTFLKNLYLRTHKQFAVVAPTGIAALNAEGVTIHSQFLLPFGMFIPEAGTDFKHDGNFYTSSVLASKHPLNSARKQVLRSLDLLVIDEVSMLRADLLDAIDYRMKAARGNFIQSFGGVQLLLIGDLYQLPPVVKREEEGILRRFYSSAWFFDSKALQRDGFVYIELDKIFRQHDDLFINLLNNLRNNKPTETDIEILNAHYKSSDEIESLRDVITLTTHNYKADELNVKALNELDTPSHILHAYIDGDFPESMQPVLHHLELKEGAQIMFVKNDGEEKMYFNGKLATVSKIIGDKVTVEMAATHKQYTLRKETWENKSYMVDAATGEITEKVIGTFEQYPVKLAWAITVHKSQGLTFDKAIIDVGQAFADGQVYVALSRLRSLDGLILRARINTDVISTNKKVALFTQHNNQPETLPGVMKAKQWDYIRQVIDRTFDFEELIKEHDYVKKTRQEQGDIGEEARQPVLDQIVGVLMAEKDNTSKFRKQLHTFLETNNQPQLLDRMKSGSTYYKKIIHEQARLLWAHLEEMRQKKRVKTYVTSLVDMDQLFSKKLEGVDKALYITEAILEERYSFDFSNLTKQRAEDRAKALAEIQIKFSKPDKKKARKNKENGKTGKKNGPSTYDVTLGLYETGMSIEAIAQERGLVTSTIDGHLARAVEAGRITIDRFMSKSSIDAIVGALNEMPDEFTSKDLFVKTNGRFSYGQLRAVMNHMGKKSSAKKGE